MAIELSQLVDGLPALVWTALPNGEIDYVSQPWCDYTGEARRSLLGRGWCRALHPNDVPAWLRSWNPASGAAGSWEITARLRRSDGAYRRFLLRAVPLESGAGEPAAWCATAVDVEDRTRAEEAANRRRLDFEQVVDGLPAIMATFNSRGNMDYCNRQMLAYLGETLAEIEAKDSGYNFHPDDRPAMLRAWTASVGSGQPFDGEARLCRSDGVYRWHRIRILPLRNGADEITMWYGLATDVDDARRAEAELSAEKQLLERVARGVALPEALEALCRQVEALAPGCACSIVLVDPGSRTLRLGAAPSLPAVYKAMLDGHPVDPKAGPYSLAVETHAPVFVANLSSDRRWKATPWAQLMGETGYASCWSTPILSASDEVLGVFAIYRAEPVAPLPSEQALIGRFTHIAGIALERARADADLKQREAELERAYEFLNEAQRLSRTGSFTWDAHPEKQFWSDEMYRTLGLEPGALVTLEMARGVIHPDDLPIYDAMVARGQAGAEMEATYRIVTTSGAVRHLHTKAHRLTEVTDRAVYLGASQDVTQSKLAEAALKAREADLDRARADLTHVSRLAMLSTLTASIAHEVNQPLAGITANASTCLRMLATEPPNVEGARATAQRTLRDSNRAAEVIRRLRALFGQRPEAREPVDLNEAIREVLALSAGELQRSRVALRMQLADDLPTVIGDRVQLQQVVLNLALNAAEAMSGVEGRARDLTVVSAADADDGVRLSVRDAGVGVAPQSLKKLFEAFHTTKPTGMGVGLAISRSIIESHGGRLWAEPNDGPGATFAFTLPAQPDAGALNDAFAADRAAS